MVNVRNRIDKFFQKVFSKIFNRIRKEMILFKEIKLIKESGYFNELWYCNNYKINKNIFFSPIRHFLTTGLEKGYDPSPLFCISAYNSVYPDVRRKKINPLLHFIQFGKPEGRINPCSYSDKEYIDILYKKKFNLEINYLNPKRFTEKIQLYKIIYQNQILCEMADKIKVRNHIENRIGKNYLVPIIKIFDSLDEVQPEKLPDQFVIKTNHGSGCVMICHDRNQFDWKSAKKKFSDWMKVNYYWIHREFSYKYIKPKIFIEQYLHNENFYVPRDYKISCFNGNPYFIEIYSNRFNNIESAYYDLNWIRLPFRKSYQTSNFQIERPEQLDEMLSIAETLSKDFPFLRVDLYLLDRKIYFGEMTFYPGAGLTKFFPDEWDFIVGSWFDISNFYDPNYF